MLPNPVQGTAGQGRAWQGRGDREQEQLEEREAGTGFDKQTNKTLIHRKNFKAIDIFTLD